MGKTLIEIAQALKDNDKRVQLIYAFNGTGKTRLSSEFEELVSAQNVEDGNATSKIIYYNAFTEDLFHWDNSEDGGADRYLMIQPNNFTDWILKEQAQETNIATHFQRYTSDKLTPRFKDDYNKVCFEISAGNDDVIDNVKISKGEESCLIWCVFYSLLELVVEVLNVAEPADRENKMFNDMEYVFIDDPVSSLDDSHLIELAVDIASLIKSSRSDLKFIITTHNPLFFNVLCNEFSREKKVANHRLIKLEDGTYQLERTNDSPFSYHLLLLSELENAIKTNEIQKYHFNYLRNILEKTATFLGYSKWDELLPEESRTSYYDRILNLYSHSKHSGEEVAIVEEKDKRMLGFLVNETKRNYGFKSKVII